MPLLAAIYMHRELAEDEDVRLNGAGDEEDLFAAVKRQVEAACGRSTFTTEKATGPSGGGLSEHSYQKMREAIDIVASGFKSALARADTSVIADDVDELLESSGIALAKDSPAYRRRGFAILKAAVKANDALAKRHEGEVVETPPNR
jgi:hypothetical protein